jgi:hypothetical protein
MDEYKEKQLSQIDEKFKLPLSYQVKMSLMKQLHAKQARAKAELKRQMEQSAKMATSAQAKGVSKPKKTAVTAND